jgi:DNA-binding winged helix-turn-helix (wHTH) protein
MDQLVPEAQYPLYFREDITKLLAEHITHRRSVELIGMKRVGINNFLRFFLFNTSVHKKYLPEEQKHVFILVDLDDLIERELFPFWRLLFKRIVDAVEANVCVSDVVKKHIAQLFIASIQSGDIFLTYDGVREALVTIAKEANPTIFFTRFDRLHNIITPEFFSNLESLKESTSQKLSYIFTNFRELDEIEPTVFHKKDMYGFSHVMYMKPASFQDIEVLLITFLEKFNIKLTKELSELIIDMSGGHAQYLQLLLIILDELLREKEDMSEREFEKEIIGDERVMLLSEELWENLQPVEQEIMQLIATGEHISEDQKKQAKYIWNTGMVRQKGRHHIIFTPLFVEFLKRKSQSKEISTIDLSKKEHMLFSLLQQHENIVCEREKIVEVVWPECKEYGVSDWSIDRLVARLRGKLKKQGKGYEIITVRTRGYKLVMG